MSPWNKITTLQRTDINVYRVQAVKKLNLSMTDSPPCASTYCLSGVPFFHFAKGFPRRRSLFLSCQHQRGHRHPLLVILARPPEKKKSNFAQPKLTQQIVARPTVVSPHSKKGHLSHVQAPNIRAWWTRNVHRSNNIPWLHLRQGEDPLPKKAASRYCVRPYCRGPSLSLILNSAKAVLN